MTFGAGRTPPRLVGLYRRVGAQIAGIAARCSGPDEALLARSPEVSDWAVGQHFEHLGITSGLIVDGILANLDSGADSSGRPGLLGYVVLATGHIPRGRAKARKEWTPADVDPVRARGAIEALGRRFAELEPHLPLIAGARSTVRHPMLGAFTPRRWLRFLEIHQRHHLAIVRDIEAAVGAGGRRAAG